jgi:hypothetical protein
LEVEKGFMDLGWKGVEVKGDFWFVPAAVGGPAARMNWQ